MIYLLILEFEVVRYCLIFSSSQGFEFGGRYMDAIFRNFETGSLT